MATQVRFQSNIEEYDDYWAWYERACGDDLTDGLPLAPPTEERVSLIVEHLQLDPSTVIGVIPPKMGRATVEQIAIQCAMAGCRPEYVPVVITALRATLEPSFNLNGVQSTTSPCTPLVIVSGPVVDALGFNSKDGCFGGDGRANAAVGRAMRLILRNIGGALSGKTDISTLGQSGKFTFCVAENHDDSPWEPVHVDFGLPVDANAVTVLACHSPAPMWAQGSADRLLGLLAAFLPGASLPMFHCPGNWLIVLSPKVAQEFARAGYTKADVRNWIAEHARYDLGWLRRSGVHVEGSAEVSMHYWGYVKDKPDLRTLPDEARLPIVRRPEDIILLVAGGMSQRWMAFSDGWGTQGGGAICRSITR